jgi:prepilin-type N-terminal cleavage/methylation domain-containing protein
MTRQRAFTLIEMIVVVAIIVVLAALILPAMRHARHTAKTTMCLSNVRQIGVILNAYLVTSQGVMPALHNRESKAIPLPAIDTALLLPGESTEVFKCPSDAKDLYNASGTSYLWNFMLNGQKVDAMFSHIGGRDASRIPVVSDKEGWHPEIRDKLVVLYADGHASRELTFLTELGVTP